MDLNNVLKLVWQFLREMWSSPLYVKNEIIEDKNYNISYKRENIKKKREYMVWV